MYDLDSPGVKGSAVSANSTKRIRVNYQEYATDSNGRQVSSTFNWFVRASCTANSLGTVSFASVM